MDKLLDVVRGYGWQESTWHNDEWPSIALYHPFDDWMSSQVFIEQVEPAGDADQPSINYICVEDAGDAMSPVFETRDVQMAIKWCLDRSSELRVYER